MPPPTQGPSGRDGPHLFVADLSAPALTPDDDHHLRRALRARPGDSVTLSDGQGRWQLAQLSASDVVPQGPVHSVPPWPTALTVGFALTKSHKPELTVQKLTEMGIDRIMPFLAERSVVRWDDDRCRRAQQRFLRVAREAAMQSRRVRLPDVTAVVDFATASGDPGVVLADRDGPPVSARHHTILVGPEGGWSDTERELQPTVGLGSTVLRAETASFVAGALLVDRHRAR